jgi:hypothetical protein
MTLVFTSQCMHPRTHLEWVLLTHVFNNMDVLNNIFQGVYYMNELILDGTNLT